MNESLGYDRRLSQARENSRFCPADFGRFWSCVFGERGPNPPLIPKCHCWLADLTWQIPIIDELTVSHPCNLITNTSFRFKPECTDAYQGLSAAV
jgi:hypothetical protein